MEMRSGRKKRTESEESGEGKSSGRRATLSIERIFGISQTRSAGEEFSPQKTVRKKSIADRTCLSSSNKQATINPVSDTKIATSFSVTSLSEIFSGFNLEKKQLVQAIGFGNLLKLRPTNKFPRQLALWVMKKMDHKTAELEVGKGEKIKMEDYDVELVLGIPGKGREVNCSMQATELEIARIRKVMMMNTGTEITIDCVEEILKRDYGSKMTIREKEAFKVAFLLWADAYFLGPKGGKAKINLEICRNLGEPSIIGDYNWCEYVRRSLFKGSRRVQQSLEYVKKTVTLEGCLLLGVVFYLDNLNFGTLTPTKTVFPRLLDYPYNVIKELEKEDRCQTNAGGLAEYGMHEVLKEGDVIYSRNKHKENRTEDERSKGTSAMKASIEDEIKFKLAEWTMKVNTITEGTKQELLECLNSHNEKGFLNMVTGKGVQRLEDESCRKDQETTRRGMEAKIDGGYAYSERVKKLVHGQQIKYDMSTELEEALKECACAEEFEVMHAKDKENKLRDKEGDSPWDDRTVTIDSDTLKALKRISTGVEGLRMMTEEEGSEQKEGKATKGEECPTPLLVVTAAEDKTIVKYGDGAEDTNYGHALDLSEVKLGIQNIASNPRFGVSPFAIGMTHTDAPMEAQMALQIAMRHVGDEELTRIWFMHMEPDIIHIDGTIMYSMFQGKVDFIPTAVDAMVRLYQQMDDEMYSGWNEKRWRHFLPTEFAVWGLSPDRGDPTTLIQDMFLGNNVTYNVIDCRLVMVPLLVHWYWCLYAWDLERKKIVVVDPMGMKLAGEEMEEKHNTPVKLMISGFKQSWELFFSGQEIDIEEWETEYTELSGGEVDRMNTGLYTMFAARYFDGKYVTRVLTKEATHLQRVNMMYQLLRMDGNIGEPPESVKNVMYR